MRSNGGVWRLVSALKPEIQAFIQKAMQASPKADRAFQFNRLRAPFAGAQPPFGSDPLQPNPLLLVLSRYTDRLSVEPR